MKDFELGDIVRISKVGDRWDGILSKIVKGEDPALRYVEFLEWGTVYGPWRERDEFPLKGGIEDFTETDLIPVSPLEQLARAADELQ